MISQMACIFASLYIASTCLSATSQTKPQLHPLPSPSAPAVGDIDLARNSTETFLKGLKIADMPEGKEMQMGVQWFKDEAESGQYDRPSFTEATTLFEKLFDTDKPEVKGYKRLLEMKAVSKAGTPVLIKYLMIAYMDRTNKQWKVLATDTGECVDLDSCLAYFSTHLHETVLSEKRTLLNYGGYLLQAGHLNESRETLTRALSAPATSTYRDTLVDDGKDADLINSQIRVFLSVIDRITGESAPGAGKN